MSEYIDICLAVTKTAAPWSSLGKLRGAAQNFVSRMPVNAIHQRLGTAAAGAGMGALGGAAKGVYDQFSSAGKTDEYGNPIQAPSLGGTVLKGALLGGAIGAAAPGATNYVAKAPVLGGAARFGQRQLHGLTGWTPTRGDIKSVETIGGGASQARQTYRSAVQNVANSTESTTPKMIGRLHRAGEGLDAAEKAQSMGLTNIPGVVRSLKNNGVLKTMGTAAAAQWKGSPSWAKALMVASPVMAAKDLVSSDDKSTLGERTGRFAGNLATGTLLGGAPIVTQMLGQGLVSGATGQVGKGIDKLRGYVRPAAQGVPTQGPAPQFGAY